MAPPAGTLRVGRYFLALLLIFVVLYALVFWPGQRHTPKLGIDLAGGQQVIFTAKSPNGKAPTSGQMEEAKQILTDRVNGSGVTESTVVIQGSDQLVVSIPGSQSADIAKLGQAAVLNLRGLVMPATPIACVSPVAAAPNGSASPAPSAAASPSPTAGAAPNAESARPLTNSAAKASPAATAKAKPSAKAKPASGSPKPAASPSAAASGSTAATPKCTTDPFKGLKFTIPPNEEAFDTLTAEQQAQLTTALSTFDCSSTSSETDAKDSYFIACDDGTQLGQVSAYLLGPVIVPGSQISSASAQSPNIQNGQADWTVALDFKSSGESAWAKYTSAHNIGSTTATADPVSLCGSTMTANGGTGTPCANYVAFTLDGLVISAPVNEQAINGGQTQIQGNFTAGTAKQLAKQLKYGALPLSFTASQAEQVSPTLGSSQLKAGLLAGGIGLILVVIYSLIYYRALGLVTIASLLVSGGLTYGALVVLATQIDFTLSLAGIAGFIVAIGITADSFVVFFERIKDEVHEGRSIRVAVPRAWVRARRTILSADTVSFLAAAILYYFAAGDVRGFAFTLGLSTILDLVVVFLFTHPLVSLLSRSRAFGSARFTGLNAVREGGIAIVDADEREAARAPKRTRAAQAQEPPNSERFAGVAVMDRRDPAAVAADSGGSTGGEDEPRAEDVPIARAEPGAGQDADGEDPVEVPAAGRTTAPEPGSAAERAAARRARLRAQGNPKGRR